MSKNIPEKDLSHEDKMLQSFIENQKQEIALKSQEIELQSKNIDNDKEVALTNIKAQSDFLNKQMDINSKDKNSQLSFWKFIAVVFTVIVAIISYSEQYEIIEKIIISTISGISGYFIGHSRKNTKDDK